MKIVTTLAFAMLSAVACAQPDSVNKYDALRYEYGEKENFDELCLDNRPIKQADDLLTKEKWESVVELLEPWVENCPVDMRANFFLKVAYMKLGNEDKIKYYDEQYGGLLKSVMDSGDGKSFDTAWKTISIAEEYDTMYLIYFKWESRNTVNYADAFYGNFQGAEKTTIHFAPEAQNRRVLRKLGIKFE